MASSTSPVASSFRSPRLVNPHHQLTWRTISDCCIKLQHSTVEWSTLKSQGMDVANDIVRVTVERLHHPLMKDSNTVSEPPLEQRELARKLSTIIKKMVRISILFSPAQLLYPACMQEAVVTKMGSIMRNLWASAELVAAERTTLCSLPAPMIGIIVLLHFHIFGHYFLLKMCKTSLDSQSVPTTEHVLVYIVMYYCFMRTVY